jgi:hypothetical protein
MPEAISPPAIVVTLPSPTDVSPNPEHLHHGKKVKVRLKTAEKFGLIKPLVWRYMVPLCLVYVEEYVINSVSGHGRHARICDAYDCTRC